MELFANRVWATLASGMDEVQTSLALSIGQGARFGTIGSGDKLRIVLLDATLNVSEIMYATARVGDTLTVDRAQDGTVAVVHLAGDRLEHRIGKSTMLALMQIDQIQDAEQAGAYTLLGSVAGVDTITANASPELTAQASIGSRWKLPAAGANTGAATLNISGQGAVSVVRPDGSALQANDIPSAEYICDIQKRAANFVLLNPANLQAQAVEQVKLTIKRIVQDGAENYLGALSGTNTLTAAANPTLTAQMATGSRWTALAAGANTGAVTINIDAQGAVAVVRPDGTALQAGDIPAASYPCRFLKRAADVVLLNPGASNKKAVGDVFAHFGDTAPAGSLVVPIATTSISRATYSALHSFAAALGYPWGVGDGATTFGMPNVPANYALVQANANARTQTVGEVIAHTHSYNSSGSLTANAGSGAGQQAGTTGSTGGAANLAAGVRVLLCVQYL